MNDKAHRAQFRVGRFVDVFAAHLGEPELEGFGFAGGNGLDNTQKLFGGGDVGEVAFAVFGRFQLQLVTICNQLVPLILQPLFQNTPIVAGSSQIQLVGQDLHHIHDREIPFLLLLIPRGADRLSSKSCMRSFSGIVVPPPILL